MEKVIIQNIQQIKLLHRGLTQQENDGCDINLVNPNKIVVNHLRCGE